MAMNEILVEKRAHETRIALLEDGALAEMLIEREGMDKQIGSIYCGRVENILPGMQAAFVNIGMEKNAFLFAGDFMMGQTDFGGDDARIRAQMNGMSIRDMLKVGQEIPVQIVKMPGGEKGPRISSHITLPGRLAVLLPTVDYLGVSRKIEDDAERERLREIASRVKPEGMGLIMRTVSAGADEDAVRRDVTALARLWNDIKRRAGVVKAPALLYRDYDAVTRAVRDLLSDDVSQMVFDDAETCARAAELTLTIAPEHADRIRLYGGDTPLFTLHNVDTQLRRALDRRVWLKSGGYLVFDATEALTVIDVNTGKFVGKNSLSDTIFRINIEAVDEIARQLRLRDIGGIVIIDFIDMDTPEQKEQLLARLRAALKRDRTHTNLIGLTGLGLVEMTRKKKRDPLAVICKKPCPHCGGTGAVLTEETVALSILRKIELMFSEDPAQALLIRCAWPVAEKLIDMRPSLTGHAFVIAQEPRADGEYEIEAVLENALPPKTRPLTRRA